MASSALPAALSPALPPARRVAWIEAPAFDLGFFILSPLLTLPIVAAAMLQVRLVPALGFLLAFAHYLSTVTFFFWQENREHHRRHWMAFFGGPALITATFCLLLTFRIPLVIQVVIFFWNVFHVSRQSSGMLSLYRQANGVTDHAGRVLGTRALLTVNLWFSLWNIESHAEVMPLLDAASAHLAGALWIGCGVLALGSLARLAVHLGERIRDGRAPALPEWLILGTGLTLFHPYLWVADSGAATFAMLLPHYVQYLGIVWLLHRRRFGSPQAAQTRGWLPAISRSGPLLMMTLLCVTVGLLAVRKLAVAGGFGDAFEGFYLLVALVHFYLDGLFWAFRDPHVRTTLGPWLINRRPA